MTFNEWTFSLWLFQFYKKFLSSHTIEHRRTIFMLLVCNVNVSRKDRSTVEINIKFSNPTNVSEASKVTLSVKKSTILEVKKKKKKSWNI